MTWRSTKTFGHELGLSACFRQWRADHSHCRFLHGYALSFSFTFEAQALDHRNWVMDFGGLKELREWLKTTFDHKTVIAQDDPEREMFEEMARRGMCDLEVVDAVGCERFAAMAGKWITDWLRNNNHRVRCISVECREHGANSAIWWNP